MRNRAVSDLRRAWTLYGARVNCLDKTAASEEPALDCPWPSSKRRRAKAKRELLTASRSSYIAAKTLSKLGQRCVAYRTPRASQRL